MRLTTFMALALAASTPALAQVVPSFEVDNPRVQSITYVDGENVLLTVLPDSGATVMFERGERIERVVLDNSDAFDIRVSPDGDGLLVLPQREDAATRIAITTDRRPYRITARTGSGLTAAYLLQYRYDDAPFTEEEAVTPLADIPAEARWTYRLRGDREVRPLAIRDDAQRTYITYATNQALPAVFAEGPSGDEEVVNGYMRGEVFVIDRVYSELVFRIDDERATARRQDEAEAGG